MLLRARMETRNGLTVVGEAADGLAAVELASELQPDLVMLDLAMPRMDGLEALPLIRAAVPGVRVIVLSGFNQSTLAEKAMEAGADKYVVKGGSMRQLLELVDTVLDARRILNHPRGYGRDMSGDQLQPEDTLDDRGVDDVLDEGYSPPEREPDHLRHPEGGESIDERLDDEEPEVWAQAEEEADADILDGDVGGEVGGARTGQAARPRRGVARGRRLRARGRGRGHRRRRSERRGSGDAHHRGRVTRWRFNPYLALLPGSGCDHRDRPTGAVRPYRRTQGEPCGTAARRAIAPGCTESSSGWARSSSRWWSSRCAPCPLIRCCPGTRSAPVSPVWRRCAASWWPGERPGDCAAPGSCSARPWPCGPLPTCSGTPTAPLTGSTRSCRWPTRCTCSGWSRPRSA